MAKFLKVILFCLFVTLTFQEDPQKLLHRVVRNKASSNGGKALNDVKPQEAIGTFGKYMKEFSTEAIGVEFIQKKITRWVKEGNNHIGKLIVTKLAETLTKRLVEKIDAVKRISDAAGKAVNSKAIRDEEYHRCCELPTEYNVTYDSRFKANVSNALFCQMNAPSSYGEEEADYSNVRTAFDTNKDKVKWQYFGSTEGVCTMFPAQRVSTCGKYDNRLRPWYVTTATPSPKNIIILLDCSTSMGRDNSLESAKGLVKIILGTLNPQDKVSVILFNASTTLPGDQNTDECYHSTMATAGTFNIRFLKSFVDSAKPKGGTRFIRAFKKVFELLRNTFRSSSEALVTRPSMIFLFTDGAPKTVDIEDRVVKTLKREIKQLKKEYKIKSFALITFGLGDDNQARIFRQKLTGSRRNGITMVYQKGSDPHSMLKPYFDYLTEVTPARGNDVVFSQPYVDLWGLGFMITAARAYFDNNQKLRGVAGVDIPMSDLLSDVQYFSQAGPRSYAFLVQTRTGHVLSHPLLPTPESITEDPNSFSILELEQGKEFKELFDKVQKEALRNARSVHQKALKFRARSLSRGGGLGDGVQVEVIDYTYSCMPLNIGDSIKDYIVCVALEKDDSGSLFKSMNIAMEASPSPITYHRMDILPEAKLCYHTDTISYADRSVVKFTAKAFDNPSKYLELEESESALKQYVDQLKGAIYRFEKSDIFAKDTVITTQLTSLLDNYWLISENKEKYLKKIVRRFIGTYNGVLRMLPGASLRTNFDHVSRPWFVRSVANKGLLTFTTPYVDILGAGHIVSISHSLETSYAKKNLFGVVGVDVTVSHLRAVLLKHLGKSCLVSGKLRCFLVDTNGFVVYHPSFENVYNDSSRILDKHITRMDATIARNLIKTGLMVRRKCQNFNVRKLQRFYEIVMKEDIYRGSSSDAGRDCNSFIILKVPNTNVFVIMTEGASCFTSPPKCSCKSTCTSDDASACECPCTSRLDYDNCNDNLTDNSTTPVCTQPSPLISSARPPLPKHPEDLGKCIKTNCTDYGKENACNEIFGCVWCNKRDDGSLLEHASCKSDRKCFGGMHGRANPFLIPYKGERVRKAKKTLILGMEVTELSLIAGGSAVALLLAISAGISYYLCKVRRKPLDDMAGLEDQFFDPTNAFDPDQFFGTLETTPQMLAMQQVQRLAAPEAQYSGLFGLQSFGPTKMMKFSPQVDGLQVQQTLQDMTYEQIPHDLPQSAEFPETMQHQDDAIPETYQNETEAEPADEEHSDTF